MAINSVSSSNTQQIASSMLQSNPPVRAEKEPDRDKDDAASVTKAAAPAPTVNSNGQTIGTTISVTA